MSGWDNTTRCSVWERRWITQFKNRLRNRKKKATKQNIGISFQWCVEETLCYRNCLFHNHQLSRKWNKHSSVKWRHQWLINTNISLLKPQHSTQILKRNIGKRWRKSLGKRPWWQSCITHRTNGLNSEHLKFLRICNHSDKLTQIFLMCNANQKKSKIRLTNTCDV